MPKQSESLYWLNFGSEKQTCETYGVTDAKAWAKEQVRLMNEAEREDSVTFNVELCSGKQYGVSKENRLLPIVEMGLFMDMEGIPKAEGVLEGVVPGAVQSHQGRAE